MQSKTGGKSAGRVQSVATRIIVDREAEIKAFVPKEYWSLSVKLDRIGKTGSFVANYYGSPKKQELENEAQVKEITEALRDAHFEVAEVKKSERSRKSPLPFTHFRIWPAGRRSLKPRAAPSSRIATTPAPSPWLPL